MPPHHILVITTLASYGISSLVFEVKSDAVLFYVAAVISLALVFGKIGFQIKIKSFEINLINIEKNKIFFLILFLLSSALNIQQLLVSFSIDDPVTTKNILTEVALESADSGSPFMTLIYVIGFVSVFIAAKLHVTKGFNYYCALVIGCLIIPSILSFSRLQLVVNTSIYFFAYVNYGKFESKDLQKIAVKFILVLIAVFLIIMALRFQDNEGNVLEAIVYYIFGGFAALSLDFNELINNSYIKGNTFYGLNAWLFKLGIIEELPSIHLAFKEIGLGYTNVYTGYRHLIVDYGIYGSLIFIVILSLISSIAYANKKKDSMIPIIALCSTYGALIFYTSAFIDARVVVGVLLSSLIFGINK